MRPLFTRLSSSVVYNFFIVKSIRESPVLAEHNSHGSAVRVHRWVAVICLLAHDSETLYCPIRYPSRATIITGQTALESTEFSKNNRQPSRKSIAQLLSFVRHVFSIPSKVSRAKKSVSPMGPLRGGARRGGRATKPRAGSHGQVLLRATVSGHKNRHRTRRACMLYVNYNTVFFLFLSIPYPPRSHHCVLVAQSFTYSFFVSNSGRIDMFFLCAIRSGLCNCNAVLSVVIKLQNICWLCVNNKKYFFTLNNRIKNVEQTETTNMIGIGEIT